MAKFGIPYMGSKGALAELICKYLPPADNFYDLFGGGFSVSHCMMLKFSKKYKNYYFNELEADTVQLIRDAIAGKYNYNVFKPDWIDRETFEKNKSRCAYTRICWSFGNNQKGYMFGKDIEQEKKALHNAVVFNNFTPLAEKILGIKKFQETMDIASRRLLCRRLVTRQLDKRCDLQQLERLEQLEQLQQLERLQQLELLELTSLSYDQIKIKPSSIIYCDPPYIGTAGYTRSFNHEKFYAWVRVQSNPVFISEYTMPSEFDVAFSLDKMTRLSGVGMTKTKPEKIFVNEAAKKLLHTRGLRTFPNKLFNSQTNKFAPIQSAVV